MFSYRKCIFIKHFLFLFCESKKGLYYIYILYMDFYIFLIHENESQLGKHKKRRLAYVCRKKVLYRLIHIWVIHCLGLSLPPQVMLVSGKYNLDFEHVLHAYASESAVPGYIKWYSKRSRYITESQIEYLIFPCKRLYY